jgi:hypothetical protein
MRELLVGELQYLCAENTDLVIFSVISMGLICSDIDYCFTIHFWVHFHFYESRMMDTVVPFQTFNGKKLY